MKILFLSRREILCTFAQLFKRKTMTNSHTNDIIYAPVTLDFVTVSVEFCSFLERSELIPQQDWIKTLLRILPLLYIKATLLPTVETLNDDYLETFVSEQDYLFVSNKVSSMVGENDVYLDVFVEDMKYSDRPVSSFISEDVADIYQDIRNFVSIYQLGLEENMINALKVCTDSFRLFWGQKLVNVLRPLHAIIYKSENDISFESDNGEEDGLWD